MTEMTTAAPTQGAAPGPGTVTEPGVYDMPADVYHADPVPGGSLSSGGARKLLPPSCPALFRHDQLTAREPSKVFELGHAAHRLVLGDGPELVLVDAPRWDTKDTKAQLAAIRAAGNVPLKRAEFDQVHAMAAAIREHPVASALFNPLSGLPERSLFWEDEPSGVWRRARLDWLPFGGTGRLIVPDYKTTQSADMESIQKSVHKFGYHQQAAWYLDAVLALGLADEAAFIFVFQEKTPPHLVTVVELTAMTLLIGRHQNRKAIEKYRECRETGRWPGYSDEVEYVSLPPYAENRLLEEMQ